jgi:hypothetical protein
MYTVYIYMYISRIHIGAPVLVAIPYQALLPSSFSHLRKYSLWGFSCVFVPALFCPSAHLSPSPFQRPPQRPPAWQSPQPLMPSTCAVAELRLASAAWHTVGTAVAVATPNWKINITIQTKVIQNNII